jgi:hypothetical protein
VGRQLGCGFVRSMILSVMSRRRSASDSVNSSVSRRGLTMKGLLTKPQIKEAVSNLIDNETTIYHQSLGKFVSTFSMVECALLWAFWECAGVPSPIAQAVFSGTRIDGAIGFINRIADAQKWRKSKKQEFQYVFTQLGHINKLRNNILHYGATLDVPGQWIVSNALFAHIPEKMHTVAISRTVLEDASEDLLKILAHLLVLSYGKWMPRASLRLASRVRKTAWRCKLPLPDHPVQKTRSTPRKRQRQQHASPP